ncbi:Oidioi.mRNA.OKI2018_I69.chr2.g4922.t1.cds [Oikopleura dioica]|uniref:Oidioi.mRNA.OKI2018_I69.chr2.g4922.t1.cds n=1 Tax=Oikopleura dioica TaxID=34765 RepID=A0ABN7SYS7_OIKDI|nr:Oidioi.mRNA.OKI2018_I69.chr2.g4922.t1.cds [Oikopleura dioica]
MLSPSLHSSNAHSSNNACMYSSSSDDQLIAQLEYYFSQDNLVQDHYLRSQMDDENYVKIMTLCDFAQVKKFIEDVADPEQHIATLVQTKSAVLQVDDYGLKIRAKSGPEKFRLVVRDVPIGFDEERVLNLFKIEGASTVIRAELATSSESHATWYVGFAHAEDAQKSMEHLRKTEPSFKVHMKKISAGHYQKQAHPRQVHEGWTGYSAGSFNMYPSPAPPVSTTGPPASQGQHHANDDLIQNFATFQYQKPFPPHLRQKKSKKAAADNNPNKLPVFCRTMYQPFIRKGIENGHPVPPPTEIPIHFTRSTRGARRPRGTRNAPEDYNRSRTGGASSKSPLPQVQPKPVPPPQFAMEAKDFPTLGNQSPNQSLPAAKSPVQPPSVESSETPSLPPLADLLKSNESPKKQPSSSVAGPTTRKSPKPAPAPKKEDLKPTPQDAPLPSTTAKSTWPNTGKTLAEVFKTQPAAPPPSEKPIPTPPKPASISSDKDSQKGGSAKTTRPVAPERKTQPRQTAPARQHPAKTRPAEPAPAKEAPKATEENATTENSEEEPGWVTVEFKKKVKDNRSETSDTDVDSNRPQKRGNGGSRRDGDAPQRRERRYTGDRAPRREGSDRDGPRGGPRRERDRRDRDRNNNQAHQDVEKTIVHPPTPPPANTLELFPNLVESPPQIPAIASPVPIQGRWADIASKERAHFSINS